MRNGLIKLRIESLGRQLKALKSKISSNGRGKNFSALYGIYKGKLDLSLEEIKKYEYAPNGRE